MIGEAKIVDLLRDTSGQPENSQVQLVRLAPCTSVIRVMPIGSTSTRQQGIKFTGSDGVDRNRAGFCDFGSLAAGSDQKPL